MDLILERIQLRRPHRHAERWRSIDLNAARTVFRDNPVRRTNSLIDTPRTKCSRRSSAQRSTSSTPSSRPRSTRPGQGHHHPGRLRLIQGGQYLNRREGGQSPTGADTRTADFLLVRDRLPVATSCDGASPTMSPAMSPAIVRRARTPGLRPIQRLDSSCPSVAHVQGTPTPAVQCSAYHRSCSSALLVCSSRRVAARFDCSQGARSSASCRPDGPPPRKCERPAVRATRWDGRGRVAPLGGSAGPRRACWCPASIGCAVAYSAARRATRAGASAVAVRGAVWVTWCSGTLAVGGAVSLRPGVPMCGDDLVDFHQWSLLNSRDNPARHRPVLGRDSRCLAGDCPGRERWLAGDSRAPRPCGCDRERKRWGW